MKILTTNFITHFITLLNFYYYIVKWLIRSLFYLRSLPSASRPLWSHKYQSLVVLDWTYLPTVSQWAQECTFTTYWESLNQKQKDLNTSTHKHMTEGLRLIWEFLFSPGPTWELRTLFWTSQPGDCPYLSNSRSSWTSPKELHSYSSSLITNWQMKVLVVKFHFNSKMDLVWQKF